MDAQVQARPRRPRPKVVTLTDAAADRVREIMARGDKPYVGLRVGVKNGGCAGQEYVLEYAEAAGPLDEVVEDHGVTILIEPKAVLFLIGTVEVRVQQSERDRRLRLRRERHHRSGCRGGLGPPPRLVRRGRRTLTSWR